MKYKLKNILLLVFSWIVMLMIISAFALAFFPLYKFLIND